jgi:hypothetical protein
VEDLALKVGEVHGVEIRQDQPPDTGRGEIHRHGRAQPAESDDEDAGLSESLLAFDAELGQQDLAAIAQELVVSHRAPPNRRGHPSAASPWFEMAWRFFLPTKPSLRARCPGGPRHLPGAT